MRGSECLNRLLKEEFNTVLDVGCGLGEHSRVFAQRGKQVTSTDWIGQFEGVVEGDYNTLEFEPHDCIWCSHVLEHQLNPNLFLKKLSKDLKPNGWLAITVPPMKESIVGGHLTLWNAGILVYNLVLAGFDCSDCKIKSIDYDVSVIVKKKEIVLPDLKYDNGDIETLKPFMPPFFKQNVNGSIGEWNWK